MSSRLNPREYDLGELRDAVRESRRERTDGPGAPDSVVERDGSGGRAPVRGTPRERSSADGDRHEPRPAAGNEDGDRDGDDSDDSRQWETDDEWGERRDDAVRLHDGGVRVRERNVPRERGTPKNRGVRTRTHNRAVRPRAGTAGADSSTLGGPRESNPAEGDDQSSPAGKTDQSAEASGTDQPAEVGETDRPGTSKTQFRADSSSTPAGRARSAGAARGAGTARSAASARSASLGGSDATGTPGTLPVLSGRDVERPYLHRLPDAYDAQLEILAWLRGLCETAGREATLEALSYYESVEWLSTESREALETFLEGLSVAEPPDPRPLDVADHRESLRYVARLASRIER